jgi:prepilin-type N-terminal cleavage/methylation domain-containing protein
MQRRTTARGFTLIELLIVLGIVVVLASFTIVITLRMQERDQVPRAATIIQGALAQAKIRAVAERQNVGVRLVLTLNKLEMPGIVDVDGDAKITLADLRVAPNFPAKIKHRNTNVGLVDYLDVLAPTTFGGLANGTDDDQNTWPDDLVLCEAVEFIRDPGDFTDGRVSGPLAGNNRLLRLDRSSETLDLQVLSNFVQVGDWMEILGLGQPYQIVGMAPDQTDPNDRFNRVVLDRDLDYPVARASYRIIRQPQPIPGEKPLALPAGAVLDLRSTVLSSSGLTFDVLFSPRGNVVGNSAAQDMIFLWVHDVRTGLVDNQVLVTVYPKTGAVLVFPVDLNSTDMYSLARSGRAANTP